MGVTWHEEVAKVHICILILSNEELATVTLSLTQDQSPGAKWYLGEKRAKIPHSPCKTKVIPILLLSSRQVWQEMGGGRSREKRQWQIFLWPAEKEKWTQKLPGLEQRKEHGWPGRLTGTQRSCQVSRLQLWSQNVASCLSNCISIQGDKLPCSLTNSVHFLNNQCPGNNMRTSKHQPMVGEGKSITGFALTSPQPERHAGGWDWGKRVGLRRELMEPKFQIK